MGTMILPVEASSGPARPADAILDIVHDISLTMGEKLLLMEGFFVHDCAREPLATDPSATGRRERARRGTVSGER